MTMARDRQGLRAKIKGAPKEAGVYVMKDGRGRILYIGKAKSLKKRLGSYCGSDLAAKTVALVLRVRSVEWQVCRNESMALLLESSLIKKHHPKYNVSIRDDKSFPMVKITNEEYPAVFVTRKKEPDGARYFGPYTSAALLREALKIIRRSFPYRSCRRFPRKACIYYKIGLSPAPCIGKITASGYQRIIENIALILDGKSEALLARLSSSMRRCARLHRYEEAGVLRDQINALGALEHSYAGYSHSDQLQDLCALLGLKRPPLRIEAFDISNIQGREATGSMVSFFCGRPDKNNYRRFRIKNVKQADDYAMTAEVIQRRYARVISERKARPDLILIDGGKAHLMRAWGVLRSLGLEIPLVSIAKEFEHIYLAGRDQPLRLQEDTPALNLMRRIRDEAHRFAVAYHHVLRRKKMLGR